MRSWSRRGPRPSLSGASDKAVANQQLLRARLPDGSFFYYYEQERDPVSWVTWLSDLEEYVSGRSWAGSLLGVITDGTPWALRFAFQPNQIDAAIQQFDPVSNTWTDIPE